MQLNLRRGFGYAFDPGRGMRGLSDGLDPAGFTDVPTGVYSVTSNDPIPSDPLLTDESGNFCLSSMFVNGQCPQSADPSILFGMGPTPNTTPGPTLTPAELAAEQSRATAWLNQIPGALSVAGKIAALTSAQITAGLQAGALKPSSTCPSGYMVAGSAQCIGASSKPLMAGVSNTTLAIGAVVFFAFLMMGGKRR